MSRPHLNRRLIFGSIVMFLLPIAVVIGLGNVPSARSQEGTSSIRIESDSPIVAQSGVWTSQVADKASSGSYLFSSGDTSDTLTLGFEGTRVEIVFVKHATFGGFAIEIDNTVRRTVVATHDETTFGNSAIIDYLDAGTHTLRVYPVDGIIAIDAFITTPVAGTPLPESSTQQSVELSGEISHVYGDSQDGLNDQFIVSLSTEAEGKIAELVLDQLVAHEYSGQTVTIVGDVSDFRQEQAGSVPLIEVASIRLADEQNEAAGQEELTGSQPFVNVLCKFSDIAGTPHDPGDYASLFDTTYPGLDHYWRQISYDNINIVGTTTVTQWYNLPQPRSYYVTSTTVDLDALAEDCVAAADADVYFPDSVGINLMFNEDIGCCAWGGYKYMFIDGFYTSYRTTWMPLSGVGILIMDTIAAFRKD